MEYLGWPARITAARREPPPAGRKNRLSMTQAGLHPQGVELFRAHGYNRASGAERVPTDREKPVRSAALCRALLLPLLLSAPASAQDWDQGIALEATPSVLPERRRVEVVNQILEDRLAPLLPDLMRETDIDLWLVINR
jgi:hypothetical protein